jgi:hypothetical protein
MILGLEKSVNGEKKLPINKEKFLSGEKKDASGGQREGVGSL